MCDVADMAGWMSPTAAPKGEGRRIPLHQMGHLCCSVIGTCLTHEDLLALARKWRVSIDRQARLFDVHGFFVRKAGEKCDISRAMERLLDQRYAGMVRRVAKARCDGELVEFWNTAVSDGRVAGAYWALMSHRHVAEELRNQVFGEIHMMSHLMGHSTRRIVGAAAELQNRLERAERHRERWATRARQAVARRDAEIARLGKALAEARQELTRHDRPAAAEARPAAAKRERQFARRERALVAARIKTRQLESELAGLTARLRRRIEATGERRAVGEPGPRVPVTLQGKAILYLGGRQGNVAQIARLAEAHSATLLHHDGGVEQSAQLIEDLVSRCDAVVCPVTCINHQACQKAKRICKRQDKPFMAVASTGRGTFLRALEELSGRIVAPAAAPRPESFA